VSHDSFLAHSEPAIAENPVNQKNLLAGSKFFSNPAKYQFKIGTFYSFDGGRTWHDSGLLPGFDRYSVTSDISIAYSSSGVAYVCVLAVDGHTNGIFVSRSDDGGRTFSSPVPVFLDSSGATFSDKPWIAVDQSSGNTSGNIYVAWNMDGSNDRFRGGDPGIRRSPRTEGVHMLPRAPIGIVISRSIDGGKSFSPPTQLSSFLPNFGIGAIPAVGPDGTVAVTWARMDNKSQTVDAIEMAISHDGGLNYSRPAVTADVHGVPDHLANGTFRNLSLPSFAISPKNGVMVVAWSDQGSANADILSSVSRDSGLTWSVPRRVNHDHLNNGKDHFQPELAIAPDGVVTCAWFDRRHDRNNRLINEEIAQSYDDGVTFGHNFRVTQTSWDPAIDAPVPDRNDTFIGDYQALAVDNQTVHPLWNDTQNRKTQEIRTAVISASYFLRH
jgi:hypothetical protein